MTMRSNRREFLAGLSTGLTALAAGAGCRGTPKHRDKAMIRTVLGSIPAEELGVTLPHEHVLVDFIGAHAVTRERYDAEDAFQKALPHLERVRSLGCQGFAECTPAYIGRDPRLLQRLAQASRLHILTNTGYYGAGGNKFLPIHALTESHQALAQRWIDEAREGIENTGVRPGFIKIGVDAGPLSELHQKLVRAAVETHWATGLTIAAHTGNGAAALEELRLVREAGLEGSAFIWVHAQSEVNPEIHQRIAEQGAWVEFDGISPNTLEQHVRLVTDLRDRGLLDRILISHDAGWYHVGEPDGGSFRPFDTLFTDFLPALRAAHFTDSEIQQLIVVNPREAVTVRVRGR
jgi:phosphotriesterase-related protein